MSLKVIASVFLAITLLEVSGLPLNKNDGEDQLPYLRRWAKFKNTKGELVWVDLYPENDALLVSNYLVDPTQVQFYMYTKLDSQKPIRIYLNDSQSLLDAGFNPKYKTKFLVHGFLNDLYSDSIQKLKNNFLSVSYEDYNIIAVDWSVYTVVYVNVDEKTEAIGNIIGEFMDFIVKEGASVADIHCIGHSLGAHACGFAGMSVKSGKIARITGLDPALPGFNVSSTSQRLDESDAEFVDCIHTCGGFLGIDEPICNADFYPNAGRNQPGCHWFDFGACSHGRSHELFAESILEEHIFPSFACATPDFTPDNCAFSGALMGYPANEKHQGVFYTKTKDDFPFSMNWTSFEEGTKMRQ